MKKSLLEKAVEARRESKSVDFKESVDIDAPGELIELVKDVVAMANSGGGVILVGVKDDGGLSGWPPAVLLSYDPAKFTDKIAKFTTRQFSEFEFQSVIRDGRKVVALVVSEAGTPLVFTKAGTYRRQNGDEKVAFQNGTIYFRHGAKSEPANPDDLATAIARQIERLRRQWLDGIKKVTSAPADHVVYVGPQEDLPSESASARVGRVVEDPKAPGFYPLRGDTEWPHRAKDVQEHVNKRLKGKVRINSHDIQAVRCVHEIETRHPTFAHRPFRRTPAQYSDAFVEWLVDAHEADGEFFKKTRAEYKMMTGAKS